MSVLLVGAVILLTGCGEDEQPARQKEPSTSPSAASRTVTSPTGQTAKLDIEVEPASPSSADNPKGVALSTTLKLGTTTGASPSELTSYTVRSTDNFELHGKSFPTCRQADLKAGRLERCERAKIGSGSADVQAPKRDPVKSTISIFNAGKRTYLFYFEAPGLDPQVMPGKVEDDERALAIEVPFAGGENNPVTRISLRSVNLTAEDGTPFLEAPAKCDGSWGFEAVTGFASGEKLRSRDTVRCSP